MGWIYGGVNLGHTPVVGDPNIALETAASEYAELIGFDCSGEASVGTLMRTRLTRATEGVGAATSVLVQKYSENAPANAAALTKGDHATTKPAPDSAGGLWGRSWNAFGGVVGWRAAPGEEIILLGVATIVLENDVGTALSSYGLTWRER